METYGYKQRRMEKQIDFVVFYTKRWQIPGSTVGGWIFGRKAHLVRASRSLEVHSHEVLEGWLVRKEPARCSHYAGL